MEFIGNPPPIYINPGANRNLGLLRDVPQRFFRYYTVPALEFKRLLHEAKERDKDSTLVYAKLPGTHGDEKWRAIATERIVSVEVRDGTLRECKVKNDFPMGTLPSE
ncbi:hypothetical protein IV203_031320 [Nitzschia inconspicua]|uniref:Uncharacterized protein n=1 Tax=Nitzschia inconspicua TaxID=303405 RepID=A0A9K3Q2A8_9STRA|nr:hypothetical protein IV203_031320 [Nitzschia inconspicua]